jgi:hypothetical protein
MFFVDFRLLPLILFSVLRSHLLQLLELPNPNVQQAVRRLRTVKINVTRKRSKMETMAMALKAKEKNGTTENGSMREWSGNTRVIGSMREKQGSTKERTKMDTTSRMKTSLR